MVIPAGPAPITQYSCEVQTHISKIEYTVTTAANILIIAICDVLRGIKMYGKDANKTETTFFFCRS